MKQKRSTEKIKIKEPIILEIQKAIHLLKNLSKETAQDDIKTEDILSTIQEIHALKELIGKNKQEIEDLKAKCCSDKMKDLISTVSLMKLSIKSIIQELTSLKETIEESFDEDIEKRKDLLQEMLLEIGAKFLSITGGGIKGDLYMNGHYIKGLSTPTSPEPSCAASVGYLHSQILPLSTQIDDLVKYKSNQEMNLSSLHLQKMSVSGGSFKGNVNMEGNRLSGIPYPRSGSDAVSLEFLQKFAEARLNKPESTDNQKNTSQSNKTIPDSYTIFSPCNTVYTDGLVARNPNPLPAILIGAGYNGFTWKKGSNENEGDFPWESLKIEKMKDGDDDCFSFPEAKNGFEMRGHRPGVYDWNFTMKALLPSELQITNPIIKLYITLHYTTWALANAQFSRACVIPIMLHTTSKTYISGKAYNLVELSPSNINSHRTITVTPTCSGVSLKLKNTSTSNEDTAPLNVIHASCAFSWRGV